MHRERRWVFFGGVVGCGSVRTVAASMVVVVDAGR